MNSFENSRSPTKTQRIGVLGIFIQTLDSVNQVNTILSEFGSCIRGRLGLPRLEAHSDLHLIAIIFEGSTDDFGAICGRLGQLSGVEAKSLLSKQVNGSCSSV